MSISFSEIPADNLVPIFATEFDGSNAVKSGAMPWKNLIIGQPLASKMSANGTLTKITSDEQADANYGAGSQLSLMIKAFRKNTKNSELWVLPIADGNAAKAKGTLTFSVDLPGDDPKLMVSGAIRLMIGGQAVAVNVAVDDTAANVATKVVNAIGEVENLPVTAKVDSDNTNKVVIEAKNGGSNGNGIDIRWNHYQGEKLPDKLIIEKTTMGNGGADPSYSTAAVKATCEGTWFNTIVIGSDEDANVNYIKEMLDERWTATVQQTGVLFFSLNGISYKESESGPTKFRIPNETDFTDRGDDLNSKEIVLAALPLAPTPGFEKAAALLGCVAPKSLNDPAQPLSNFSVSGIVGPKPEDREGFDGNNALLKSGCALLVTGDDGSVSTKRIVTTYKKNAAGAKDTAYMQLETVMTLSYLRWDWNNYMAVKYGNAKLADDGNKFGAGQVVMTPELGKAELLSRYQLWMEKGLVQNYEDFAANVVVQLDPDDAYAMQFLIPAHLIKQFFVGKSKIQFD